MLGLQFYCFIELSTRLVQVIQVIPSALGRVNGEIDELM